MESIQKLEEFMKLAKQYGVLYLKTPEFEFTFTDKIVEPSLAAQPPIIVAESELPKPEISDEDMLFWSVETPKSQELK